MEFVKNERTNKIWSIPCPNYYGTYYSAMFYTILGTEVDFIDKDNSFRKGWVTYITTLGVNVTTLIDDKDKTRFIKWENVLGVYIDEMDFEEC